jgi:hypothetical protein
LRENEFYDYELDFDTDLENVVYIEINWGDWKHDHLRLRLIMEKYSFLCAGEVVTEEDGSDCYSAVHTYICGK